MTTEESLITDEARALIGEPRGPFPMELTRGGCRLFARAVGHVNPIFFDVDAARAAGYRDIPAAPGYFGTWPWSPTNPENRHFVPQVPAKTTRGLNGGTESEYFETPCAGDTLFATGRITRLEERRGSLGQMMIETREVEYRLASGELVALVRGTSIRY